jgi:hypothetical protein
MIKLPENIPAPPTPATALPIMSAVEEGAAAQTVEPTSNIVIAMRNIHFAGKMTKSLPKSS